jgi:sugar lactone lactonase YvrE
MLRYLDTGKYKYLYIFTAVVVLHFTTKETAFIYSLQAALFLAGYLIYRLLKMTWRREADRSSFSLSTIIAVMLILIGMVIKYLAGKSSAAEQPLYPTFASIPGLVPNILLIIGIIAGIAAVYFVLIGLGFKRIRQERSFDILILLVTLVLPQASAFGINFFGWTVPVNASEVQALTLVDLFHMALIIVPLFIISIVVGLLWNRRQWLINAAIWYTIYIVFYTSVFTNVEAGFFTGLVGSLGYWLAQQGVNRGDQPIYYYALIQIPMYEFLPAIGSIIGIVLAIMGRKKVYDPNFPDEIASENDALAGTQATDVEDLNETNSPTTQIPVEEPEEPKPLPYQAPVVSLLIFWAITSLLAYSVAGEKMPWLTVHITLPMILLSGWAIGYLADTTDWKSFRTKHGWIGLGLLVVIIPALLAVFRIALGNNPPFAGRTLDQLAATSGFMIALLVAIAGAVGLVYITREWSGLLVRRGLALVFLGVLAVLTARSGFIASFKNYDLAEEYLVYAHCAPGDKIALQQITDISRRLTGSLDLIVAYDDKTTYPFWWYLRNFPNQRYYGSNPTKDLRDVDLILVGQDNFGKIEPVVGQAYNEFEYIRIWWPNMDYFNLTWSRLIYAITNPQMREAILQIWLNRDYSLYGQLANEDMSLQNWSPSEKFRLYIRKDVVSQLWDYGSTTSSAPVQADPYEGKQITVNADQVIGTAGSQPGQFQNPRDMALAPDGTIYVADTFNNRIQHLAADGSVLQVWGTFADISKGEAPGGTFYEPWGIAVGADGSVYVTDTWNHRIQKFSADGKFVNMWGYFGQAETPFALWGPRDIAINSKGQLFITDTGNKRVVVYDENGNYVTQFGSVGLQPGQFDEPVGIAIDQNDAVYIADTWNQRIQVMVANVDGSYLPLNNWEVYAWYGQSLDNKPFLALDANGNLYATDPEGNRVLHFTSTGTFVNYFGDYGTGTNGFNLPTGIISDGKGGVWVADAGNNRIMHFSVPAN